MYEGYGPSGVAVIVEALTDNRNRTASEVRHTFAKSDGNLGGSGAVAWLFERRRVVLVAGRRNRRGRVDARGGRGWRGGCRAGRVESSGDRARRKVSRGPEAIECAGFAIDSAELTMVPKTTVEVVGESDAKKILRLIDELEDNDDVQDVFANFDIPEGVLEAVAG